MVYLDISKTFDGVWHKGLLFKLKSVGIRDPHLGWLRVTSLIASSEWSLIDSHRTGAIPQGSVLGPLSFLISINEVTGKLKSDAFRMLVTPPFLTL